MAYKFEIKSNAVVVTDTITSEVLIAQPSKNTWFEETKLDIGSVSLYGMSGTDQDNIRRYKYDNKRGFPINECQDQDGTTFSTTSFREWCYENLAFSSAGSSASSTSIGFIDYNDNTGEIDLITDTWTDVPNNGAGAFTNKAYAPSEVNELLDVLTGYLDFTELDLGSSVQVRIDFKVKPNINNATLECRYVLGNGGGEYALTVFEKRLDRGSGIDYDSNKGSFLIYMGDDNTRLNAGKLQVKLSSDGKLTNAGVAIQIFK